MIRWLFPLLLALPTLATAQTSSRLEALGRRDQVLGWEAVGRVDLGNSGYCTGTLIAPNLVLTAAHCLFDAANKRAYDPATIQFRAGLRADKVIAKSRVRRAVAHPDYIPFAPTSTQNIANDVALLELAEPIAAARAAPFAVAAPGAGDKISVVSYAHNRDDTLSWQRACNIKQRSRNVMAFDCDVDKGSSGAPVFDLSGERARIISIISSGNRDSDGVVSFGMMLPTRVAALKNALITGKGVLLAKGDAPRAQIRRISVGVENTSVTAGRFVKAPLNNP